MQPQQSTETQVSVLMARNGPVIVFQGLNKQALFIARENVQRFIKNPQHTSLLVIPPLASLALHCYQSLQEVDLIELRHEPPPGGDFSLTIHNRGEKNVRFYSDHRNLPSPKTLRADGVRVVITPKIAALTRSSNPEPQLSVIVEHPVAERPNYRARFAHELNILRHAVLTTVARSQPINPHEYP